MSKVRAAVHIANAILRELWGRKGFNWWWDDIDEETQREIRHALIRHIMARLP